MVIAVHLVRLSHLMPPVSVCLSWSQPGWLAGPRHHLSVSRGLYFIWERREGGDWRPGPTFMISRSPVCPVMVAVYTPHTSHQAASLPRSQMRNKPSKGSQWLVELDSRSVMLWVCWLLTTPLRKWDMQTIPAQQTVNYSSPIYQWFSSFLLWVQIILRRQNKWSEKVNLHTLETGLSSKVRVSLVRRNWYQWDLMTTVLCSKWKIFSSLPLSIWFGPELVRALQLFYFWDWPNPLDGVDVSPVWVLITISISAAELISVSLSLILPPVRTRPAGFVFKLA